MGMAAELARNALEDSAGDDLRQLRDRFEKGILEQVPEVEVNGDPARRVPNTSNLYFPGLDGESILTLLEKQNICCSSGSACNTGSVSASHVLKAMGFADSRARSSLRFSVSRMNTPEEIDKAVAALTAAVGKLREIGPGSGPVKFAD